MFRYRVLAKNPHDGDSAPFKLYEIVAPDEKAAREFVPIDYAVELVYIIATAFETAPISKVARLVESTVKHVRP